jgi:hypothetical protein
MHWGDTQSFFQVVLALNIAYYSFRGLWSLESQEQIDVLTQTERELQAIRSRLEKRIEDPSLTEDEKRRGAEWLRRTDINAPVEAATIYKEGVLELFHSVERKVGGFCLADAAVCMLLLIYSTLHYGHRLAGPVFWVFMVFTLLPTVAVVLLNSFARRSVQREVSLLRDAANRRRQYWEEFEQKFPSNVPFPLDKNA